MYVEMMALQQFVTFLIFFIVLFNMLDAVPLKALDTVGTVSNIY